MNEQRQALLGGISVIVLSILPVIYTLLTRSRDDYFNYSLIIGVIFVSLIVVSHFGNGVKKAFEDVWLLNFVLFKAIFVIPFSGLFYYSLLVVLHDLFLFLYKSSSEHLTVVVPAVLTLVLGISLYRLRLKQRVLYGISEVIVGITVAVSRVQSGFSIEHPDNTELYIAILTAGIYLVVRGLDNIDAGLKTKPNTRFFKWLFGNPSSSM
ncbi:hypothetical protein [Methylobacter sp. BlB1]|uniref:hypothetical protein n=1 Tax=Methylobacter sp. BlB1 TaxID=2785914 RepID=UPI0018961E49|nr:hypothetical protein [Methylobacter sp. BlB1]MBF6650221.1 hypothetical protein [Methylobacter sp. BlB1]